MPRSTIVLVTTDLLVIQVDYLTYEEYSKFSSTSTPISYISQVTPNRTMFYRYHRTPPTLKVTYGNPTLALTTIWAMAN